MKTNKQQQQTIRTTSTSNAGPVATLTVHLDSLVATAHLHHSTTHNVHHQLLEERREDGRATAIEPRSHTNGKVIVEATRVQRGIYHYHHRLVRIGKEKNCKLLANLIELFDGGGQTRAIGDQRQEIGWMQKTIEEIVHFAKFQFLSRPRLGGCRGGDHQQQYGELGGGGGGELHGGGGVGATADRSNESYRRSVCVVFINIRGDDNHMRVGGGLLCVLSSRTSPAVIPPRWWWWPVNSPNTPIRWVFLFSYLVLFFLLHYFLSR